MAIYMTTLRGNVGAGDIWQAGFALQSDDFIDGLANDVVAALVAEIQPAADAWSPSTTFADVLVSEINEANGHVVDSYVAGVGFAGTSGVNSLPPEVACCISLRETNGTVRGRFYLPPFNAAALTAAGRLLPATQVNVANMWQDFFVNLGALTAPARLGIYSRKLHQFRGVTTISVGDVYDAQRRRRNKLIESRQTRTIS